MATLAKVSVLIVEDSLADAKLTQLWLAKTNFVGAVRVARTGQEGLEILRSAGESGSTRGRWLVLLDVHLPDMLGWELLEELRRQDALPQVRVIVLTGTVRTEDARRAQQAGAARYLAKPFDAEEFAALMREIEAVAQES